MNLLKRSVVVGSLLAVLGGASAHAGMFSQNIYLTFADPVGQREVRYVQPATAADLGTLTYNTSVPITLSFDFSDFGIASPLLITVNLQLNASVGPASAGAQPDEFLATTFGTFEYRRASDNAVMIAGSFNDASLSFLRNSGGLTANGLMNGGRFNMDFTPALIAEMAGAGYNFGGFDTERFGDASWTLTGVPVPGIRLMTPSGSAEQFFANFTSNAAFTATVPVIPTPGAVSLAVAAGMIAFGIRRR